jgi:hypothetical protein
MPFFFIAPLWLLCVLSGIVLLFSAHSRRLGYFVIGVPTGATIGSFVLSISIFWLIPSFLIQSLGSWGGVALIAAYCVALGLGGFAGGIAMWWLLRRMLPKNNG